MSAGAWPLLEKPILVACTKVIHGPTRETTRQDNNEWKIGSSCIVQLSNDHKRRRFAVTTYSI